MTLKFPLWKLVINFNIILAMNFKIISCSLFVTAVTLSVLLYLQHNRMNGLHFIIVDKQKLMLSIFNNEGEILRKFPVSVGTGYGNKVKKGDMKTPEGIFTVQEIADAHDWEYDFLDSLGPIKGAYGPWFIRLNVPGQKGIGLHGTHDSSTIGERISHGCIRMKNIDIMYLKSIVKMGSPVIIMPGLKDYEADLNDTLNIEKAQNQ